MALFHYQWPRHGTWYVPLFRYASWSLQYSNEVVAERNEMQVAMQFMQHLSHHNYAKNPTLIIDFNVPFRSRMVLVFSAIKLYFASSWRVC